MVYCRLERRFDSQGLRFMRALKRPLQAQSNSPYSFRCVRTQGATHIKASDLEIRHDSVKWSNDPYPSATFAGSGWRLYLLFLLRPRLMMSINEVLQTKSGF